MRVATERTHFMLPDSQVKCPGFLLSDKKQSVQTNSKHQKIQELLAQFLAIENNSLHSLTDLPAIPIERSAVFTSKRGESNWSVNSRPGGEIRGPGRLKSMSEGTPNFIHKAKELLQVFNVHLIVRDLKNSREIRSLLEVLIPEICFFPCNFYESINIRNIIIAREREDIAFLPNENGFFLNEHDTSEKVLQRFHEIMFHHLLIANQDLLKRWQEHDSDQNDASRDKFKIIFMALMNSSNDKTLKLKAKRLRELLEKSYPEAMTEQKFKLRAKNKRKMIRVQFSDSLTTASTWTSNL